MTDFRDTFRLGSGELILHAHNPHLSPLRNLFLYLWKSDELTILQATSDVDAQGQMVIAGDLEPTTTGVISKIHIYLNIEDEHISKLTIDSNEEILDAVEIGGFSFEDVKSTVTAIHVPDTQGGSTTTEKRISAILTKGSVAIPISLNNYGNDYHFEFDTSITDAPSMDDLVSLLGGSDDLTSWLPEGLKEGFSVQINRLHASINIENEIQLKNISLELGFGDPPIWKIIDGFDYLAVGDLKARLEVDEPLSAHRFAQVHLSGALFLGSPQNPGRVDLGVRWPDLAVTGSLATGDTIELAWLLDEIGIPVIGPTSGDKALRISQLSFSAEPDMVPKSFAFSMAVDNLWSLSLNGRELFALEQISMSLACQHKDGLSQKQASFGANMSLAGHSFSASAQSNELGWQISAWSNENLKPLDWINKLMGNAIGISLPEDMDDLVISSARVSYHSGTGEFILEGAVEKPWEIPGSSSKLESISFSISHSPQAGFTLNFSGQISIKDIPDTGSEVMISVDMGYESGNWSFAGDAALDNINLKNLADKLVPDGVEAVIPDLFEGVEVTNLGVTFESAQKHFGFTIAVETDLFPGDDITSNIRLDLSTKTVDEVKLFSLKGELIITDTGTEEEPGTGEEHKFLLGFSSQAGEKSFLASYQGELPLQKVLGIFSKDVASLIPSWMSPTMNGAHFLMSPAGGSRKKARIIFALAGQMRFDLGELELVGKFLGETAIEVNTLIQVSSEVLPDSEVAGLKALLSDVLGPDQELFEFPDEGLGQGFAVDISLGGDGIDTVLAMTPGEDANFKFANYIDTASDDQAAPDSKTQWKKSKKKFGPVFINKIGVTLEDGKFKLIIDGGMSLGGFTFALLGLGVAVPLKKPFYPDFSIEGLGLDYRAGNLHMTGAFLAQNIIYDGISRNAYMGEAQLTVGNKSFKAIGSYVDIGEPSFFLFSVVTIPIGGPSYFFVTGFAAGFGINSSLNIPPIDDVRNFIFLKAAFNETKFDDANPGENLRLIHPQIPPRLGSYWMAVGLKVSHVVVLESFFLATVEFGKRLEINLLGLSRLNLPPPGRSVAKIEMALRARFIPDEGFLSIEGRISPGSYVINPLARLGGGFAFYSWFKDDSNLGISAGDFVMSMGGYHPRFKPPAHYPVVPRLSLSWQLSSNIIIKGQMYYALTPDVMMAGGRLEAKLDLGAIQAWFNAEAHFIVHFSPFKYNANISVSMGASLEIDLLLATVRISISFSAQLELWGPEFGGYAEVDLAVVEFEVEFGAGRPAPPPLPWIEFQQKFLPKPEETVQTTVARGLVKDISSTSEHHGLDWILNPNDLKLNLESPIPFRTFEFDGLIADQNWALGVAPMHLSQVDSELTITISKGRTLYDKKEFTVSEVTGAVPKAYWASSRSAGIPDGSDSLIKDVFNGLSIVPAKDVIDITGALDVKKLLRDATHFQVKYDKHPVAIPENDGSFEMPEVSSPDLTLFSTLTLQEFGLEAVSEFTFNKTDSLLLESDPKLSRIGAFNTLDLIPSTDQ